MTVPMNLDGLIGILIDDPVIPLDDASTMNDSLNLIEQDELLTVDVVQPVGNAVLPGEGVDLSQGRELQRVTVTVTVDEGVQAVQVTNETGPVNESGESEISRVEPGGIGKLLLTVVGEVDGRGKTVKRVDRIQVVEIRRDDDIDPQVTQHTGPLTKTGMKRRFPADQKNVPDLIPSDHSKSPVETVGCHHSLFTTVRVDTEAARTIAFIREDDGDVIIHRR